MSGGAGTRGAGISSALRGVRVAFYAPMKPPDHPVPSGDRTIARLTLAALRLAGAEVALASRLRILDKDGDPDRQAALIAEAAAEVARILAAPGSRPDLWVTYHCHHKAPDLLGPEIARGLDIPYAISEPSVSPRRRNGRWARFAALSETAIGAADRLFWTTTRDRPALEAAGAGPRMVHLPAFLEAGAAPAIRTAGTPLRLLSVAMMRPGDKAESYVRLARALHHLDGDWRLEVIGDGPERTAVEAAFAPLAPRVRFRGAMDDAGGIRRAMEAADLLVWPGVGEGVGMVWLEAGAAGLPVVAEDGPAARDLLGCELPPAGDAPAFAAAIRRAAADRAALGRAARECVEARHTIEAAAATLGRSLAALLPTHRRPVDSNVAGG